MITKEQTLDVSFRTVDGLRIRYADTGTTREPTLLLTSPWPESVYAFAPMWATLAEHARLFAIDLPGFGASERRHDLLSPRAMGPVPGPAHRRGQSRPAAYRRTRRRHVGRLVRGGGTSGSDREPDCR
jgi:pimeloyl-ACP methyl ester carboxylesterase